ncbi:dephospho-CoA kinase [Batrachochytrium dendrobatidis JEL423]|uniref:Dephospho-CoA kinase n=1 Tax=Batrachochytrium dendrobatidis (strain JEL423) TaxID=403673 RepID=A0A177WGP2_BATDL|nr:dephospho-CoA kinase [Batrachochytrium dendrobatidis JEL423]
MRIVGLTGGIATGKSTVSSFLTVQKIPVVDADLIARQVVLPDTPAYHSIISTFGSTILNPDKTINRTDLGALIFSNSELREKLNHITHPYIRLEMLRQVIWHFITGETLCVLDTPLLFEAKLHRWVHTVVVVYCVPDASATRIPTLSTPGQTKQVGSNDNLLQYPTTLSDISLPPAAERFN